MSVREHKTDSKTFPTSMVSAFSIVFGVDHKVEKVCQVDIVTADVFDVVVGSNLAKLKNNFVKKYWSTMHVFNFYT